MLWLASTLLYAVYFTLPAASLVHAGRRGPAAVRGVAGAWFSGTVLAAGVLVAYAVGMNGSVSAGQALLGLYFGVGVLLFLRLVDAGFANALRRVLTRGRPRTRAAIAFAVRLTLFGGLALPWVMAVLMVNRPRVTPDDPPGGTGLPYETVGFPAADGTRVAGRYFAGADDADTTVLLCHGLGGTADGLRRLIDRLHEDGVAVLAIDLRAHGDSGGQRCTFGVDERHDAAGATRWLKQTRGDSARRVVGVGASLGAAALLAAAADEPGLDGVAVLGGYASLADEVESVSRTQFVPPLGWLVRRLGLPMASLHAGVDLRTVRPADDVARLWPRPVLVVHGTHDEIVPFEQGRRLYDAAPVGRESYWVTGGTHNGVLDDAGVIERVIRFVRSARPVPVV